MSPWDGLNRRTFPRVNYPCQVVIRNDLDEKVAVLTHTENLGIGGVCLSFKKNLKIFSTVEVELDLMDLEEHIKCKGKVVWSVRRKSDDPKKPLFYDVGIEFVDIDDKNRQRVEAIVGRMAQQAAQGKK